jgi:hypothetical protein
VDSVNFKAEVPSLNSKRIFSHPPFEDYTWIYISVGLEGSTYPFVFVNILSVKIFILLKRAHSISYMTNFPLTYTSFIKSMMLLLLEPLAHQLLTFPFSSKGFIYSKVLTYVNGTRDLSIR